MSNTKEDLLIEIGTEELPPKALNTLILAFKENICAQIENLNLSFSQSKTYATPRRLAVILTKLDAQQPDQTVLKRGPAVKAAYDKDGKPSKAAFGFAKSCKVDFDQLETLKTDKGEWLSFNLHEKGQTIQELIPAVVESALDKLPIPKRMRWGDSKVSFVRPVHWTILLFGKELIKTDIYSIKTSKLSRGHRFHHPEQIEISEPNQYEEILKTTGFVIADFDLRKEMITSQIHEIAKSINAKPIIDPDLLNEVTSMVEFPQAILGDFDKAFLSVPAEALISAMKNHQKYFHLEDNNSALLPNFITISNIKSKEPNQVKIGNERVIRPRLADAQFFWQQDQKNKLDFYLESLKSVTFQNKLGSLFDKTTRIKLLTSFIGKTLKIDEKHSQRAALLSKCDLITNMVGEFPDLQGTMGRYYALKSGENESVALAIEQHYRPRFSGDLLPEENLGQALALAEKIDTLVGIFGIGKNPTGDKDPFGLRRAALGCVRILIEKNLNLDLTELLVKSAADYKATNNVIIEQQSINKLYQFILGRVVIYYNNKDFSHDIIESVICLQPNYLNDLNQRLHALKQFQKLPEAESLAAANKRISNILKKSGELKQNKVKTNLLEKEAEKSLAEILEKLTLTLDPLLKKGKYEQAMKNLSALRKPVDDFFDTVMVMDENLELRNNRLTLLKSLRDQFLRIADISKLQH